MGLTCNINRKGRVIRGISGGVATLLGAGLLWYGWPPGVWLWIVGAGLILAGLFQLVEATLGWCAVRAMGFRTPI